MLEDPRIQKIIHSPSRPNFGVLIPLLQDYQIDSPAKLFEVLEKLTHLWAENRSTEADWA